LKAEREKKTVSVMIEMYCRKMHGRKKGGICGECRRLNEYALGKIDACGFLPDKPVCNKCSVHCYEKNSREFIKKVMRYAGPKMIRKHPYLALLHMADGFKDSRKKKRKGENCDEGAKL